MFKGVQRQHCFSSRFGVLEQKPSSLRFCGTPALGRWQDQAMAADPGARPSRADSGMGGLLHAGFGTAALSQAL